MKGRGHRSNPKLSADGGAFPEVRALKEERGWGEGSERVESLPATNVGEPMSMSRGVVKSVSAVFLFSEPTRTGLAQGRPQRSAQAPTRAAPGPPRGEDLVAYAAFCGRQNLTTVPQLTVALSSPRGIIGNISKI